jgi:ankyrin repeat protein
VWTLPAGTLPCTREDRGCGDPDGHCACACLNCQLTAARNLLHATGGRSVDQTGGLGITPLAMACRYGFIEMAALLIDYGAGVNTESIRGSVPLIEAAKGNHTDLVSMLLSREALVGRRNKHGMTAADWALRNGHRCGCVASVVL